VNKEEYRPIYEHSHMVMVFLDIIKRDRKLTSMLSHKNRNEGTNATRTWFTWQTPRLLNQQ